jgi:hypothetical protein
MLVQRKFGSEAINEIIMTSKLASGKMSMNEVVSDVFKLSLNNLSFLWNDLQNIEKNVSKSITEEEWRALIKPNGRNNKIYVNNFLLRKSPISLETFLCRSNEVSVFKLAFFFILVSDCIFYFL